MQGVSSAVADLVLRKEELKELLRLHEVYVLDNAVSCLSHVTS